MDESSTNAWEALRQKFPQLQPVNSPPSLATLNGVGVGVYGKRDFDGDTQSYVKTRCLCLIFIPLVALDAWRVVDAPGRGWYFLGREPLSPFARTWNKTLGLLTALLVLYASLNAYITSPTYLAGKDLSKANNLLKAGQPLEAARVFQQLAVRNQRIAEAQAGYRQALMAAIQTHSPTNIIRAFELAAKGPANLKGREPVLPYALGLKYVEEFRSKTPETALAMLDATVPFGPATNASAASLRRDLLKNVLAANPTNTPRAVELALLLESDQAFAECAKVLTPVKGSLGVSEGARILGEYYLKAGQNDEAYPLLHAYVQQKLDHLRSIEKQYTNLLGVLWQEGLRELKAGQGGQDFYQRYKAANRTQQDEMVEQYIHTKMQRDGRLQRAQADLKAAGKIVNITLDLGILQLNRAQGFTQPAQRQAELEAAEKTFLAIRSFAGDSDEYQMFLGQVYCWLGKASAGREQFERLLAKHQRAYRILASLAATYRDLGDRAAARELIEEAYQKAGEPKEKQAAAMFRAHVQKDTDDQIAWLEKSDPNDLNVQVGLNSSRGEKLLEKGDKPGAAALLSKAVAGYLQMPKTSVVLNNCALTCFRLHEATGDAAHRTRALAMLREAVDLEPGNSVLLINTLHFLIADAVRETVGDAILPEALGGEHGLEVLSYLYHDDSGRGQVYDKLRATDSFKTALGLLDRALLLAPKNLGLYDLAHSIYASFRDAEGLRKLQDRFQVSSPDLAEVKQRTLELYSNAPNTNILKYLAVRQPQLQVLLEKPAIRSHPRSRHYLLTSKVSLGLIAESHGQNTDLKQMLALAEEAVQLADTAAGHYTLATACGRLAVSELSQQHAEFAALASRGKKAFNPRTLLALELERQAGFAATARTNQNLRRLIDLTKAAQQAFPTWPDPSDWAFLRSLEPALAETLAASFKNSEISRRSQEFAYQLNPWQVENVLDFYWMHQLLGDTQRAQQVYRDGVKAGAPLP